MKDKVGNLTQSRMGKNKYKQEGEAREKKNLKNRTSTKIYFSTIENTFETVRINSHVI